MPSDHQDTKHKCNMQFTTCLLMIWTLPVCLMLGKGVFHWQSMYEKHSIGYSAVLVWFCITLSLWVVCR